MTDDQFERIKKGLNFHSEGGVYNLCTLTETAFREIIEDAVKFYEKQQKIDALHIMELQKQNGELTDELKTLRESVKDYGAGCYENGLRNGRRSNKLTEAKEIIRELLNIIDHLNEDEYGKEDFPVVHKAEAFLKE